MNHGASLFAAYAAGLASTLVLAAFLTPRAWWRRANLQAATVLAAGTLAIGGTLAWLFVPTAPAQARPIAAIADPPPRGAPEAGMRYRVHDHLNLRGARGIGAVRLGVVPAGATVIATGAREGDWWEVSASLDGQAVRGWASSLWLRRTDEARP
ncbi:hypothetical protein GCM10027321_41470 [Massilia terrae]|uniref:SH3 domain-containing protein n=1 Tax=Massilia terrae TaxID=1811224 RepID=A0ABT2CUK3_9BURK|nr:SH3 domain-containing protein [Massilia terrae]MCS0657661.1 SH3 domain-containing protein [Massilia terrae]